MNIKSFEIEGFETEIHVPEYDGTPATKAIMEQQMEKSLTGWKRFYLRLRIYDQVPQLRDQMKGYEQSFVTEEFPPDPEKKKQAILSVTGLITKAVEQFAGEFTPEKEQA